MALAETKAGSGSAPGPAPSVFALAAGAAAAAAAHALLAERGGCLSHSQTLVLASAVQQAVLELPWAKRGRVDADDNEWPEVQVRCQLEC